jgi:hypothetical protein
MGSEAALRHVVAPAGDATGDAGGAGALAAFRVGAGAEDGVAVDDGGRFHPRTVLAAHRHVADLVGRAGGELLDAAAAEERLGASLGLRGLLGHALDAPVAVVDAGDELAGGDGRVRGLHHLVAVEVELGVDRVHAARHVVLHEARGGPGAGDVAGLHQPFGAQRLAVAHQQVHGFRLGAALAAVQHGLLGVGELHGGPPSPAELRATTLPMARGNGPSSWIGRTPTRGVAMRACRGEAMATALERLQHLGVKGAAFAALRAAAVKRAGLPLHGLP